MSTVVPIGFLNEVCCASCKDSIGWSLGAPRTRISDYVVNVYCKTCTESWENLNRVLHDDTTEYHSQH